MIVNHGSWSLYAGPSVPKDAPMPHQVLYAKRDGAGFGQDWYEYVASKPFGSASVVMSVERVGSTFLVQAATFDPSEIFPAGMFVIEETEYVGSDPFGDYHGLTYTPPATVGEGGTLGAKYEPPPPGPTPTEIRMQAVIDDLVARLEKLEREKIDAALS